MKHHFIRASLLAVACSLSLSVFGQTAERVDVNVSPGDLVTAINALRKQTGAEVMFRADELKGLRSAGVKGNYSSSEALSRLLVGSGYVVRVDVSGAFAIVKAAPRTKPDARDPKTRKQAAEAESDEVTELETIEVRAPEVMAGHLINMDIPRSADDAQPYVVFGREEIQRSGLKDIDSFLRERLSSNSTSISASQTTGGANNSYVNLRGLFDQTLILVDGRRAPPRNGGGGFGQPDLNGIPLEAVERIEVLPTTASGIYGGSATGGVVNVILRRDYNGFEATVAYGDSFDGGGNSKRLDIAGGFQFDSGRTSIMISGSVARSESVLERDRDFIERGRAHILRNNPQSILGQSPPLLGATTNIATPSQFDLITFLTTGQIVFLPGPDLVLDDGTPLNSNITYVPNGYAGAGSDAGAGLLANAGMFNLDAAATAQAGGARQGLVNESTVKSVSVTARHEITYWLDGYLELASSENTGRFANNAASASFLLVADAPANPFQQDIYVTTAAFGADQFGKTSDRSDRLVGGLVFKLPKNWNAALDYTWSRARTTINSEESRTLNAAAGQVVANGVTEDGQPFDVMRDTNLYPISFAPYLTAANIYGPRESTFQDLQLRFSGPADFIKLPGGSPALTFMLESRNEKLEDTSTYFPASSFASLGYDQSQRIDTAYAEVALPIVSSGNRIPAIESLELQVGVRWDRYDMQSGYGRGVSPDAIIRVDPIERNVSSLNSTVSLRYQPVSDITFRASYGTGFLPPPLASLVPGGVFPADGVLYQLTDPRRGGEFLGNFTYTTGGNPELDNENSKAVSAGIIVEPRFLPGLRFSADWVRIEKRDNVTQFRLEQQNINNEALIPGYITRGPAGGGFDVGPITNINLGSINVAKSAVEAIDIALQYRIDTQSWGSFTATTAATRNLHYTSQVLTTLPEIDELGRAGALKWRGNVAVAWEKGPVSAEWRTRYLDSYCLNLECAENSLTESQGSVKVPSQTYHDFSLRYRPTRNGGPLANTTFSFGVRNVFNTKPPVDVNEYQFYSKLGDPRLGSYFVSFSKSF